MKIFNILITILSAIIIYIIFQNYNNTKIEKFTEETEEAEEAYKCTASLTDWEKVYTIPSGKELTNYKWSLLKKELSESSENVVSFTFKNDLFTNMDNILDYTIDINDYFEIDNSGSKEYWKPIKKWKEGVVSHFCKELCVLKLGYEWIKTDDITGLIELSNDSMVANDDTVEPLDNSISAVTINEIKQLIRETFILFPSSTYSVSTNEYAILDKEKFDTIIGSSYLLDNNYIDVDGTYYKVAANIPTGRKWKVYESGSYSSSEIDGKLHDINEPNVEYFNNLNVTDGDIIILTESNYKLFFTDNEINLTEKFVIHPYTGGESSKVFKPELFEYDKCYLNSCTVFANREFDDYLKLINLRESMGYKTSSLGHTADIMYNSKNNLLDLVNKLQEKVNDRPSRGNCSYSLMIDKLIEVIKIGEYVRQDDSTHAGCTKTYDPHTYVKKPTIGIPDTYTDICNDLNVNEYRRKINPEIYKYITTEWIDKDENINYNFEKQWDTIKESINLIHIYGNDSLKNKIISKNQLTELIVKYLDDVEYYMHEYHRKPYCIDSAGKFCYGSGIIIENPNTQQLMDSKNNILDENDKIEVYTDKNSYYWKEVFASDSDFSSSILPTYLPENLGKILLNGTREFSENELKELNVVITLTRNSIYEYQGTYYKYLGLFPRYIRMGKIAPDKYIEITGDNIENVGIAPEPDYITKTLCNDELITKIDDNRKTLLDPITLSTNVYYENLLNVERGNINNLKEKINSINANITSANDNLCTKYDSDDYKLYTKYNLIKFIKNTSFSSVDKINLNGLAQKTIKLKKISSNDINKKFNKEAQEGTLTDTCRDNECRNFGNITGDKATILNENINGDEIIISLNDFARIIVNKVNILENDYLYHNSIYFKIFEIYSDNIHDKIDNDFSKESYPDIFEYTYDDFISINIDLHMIDINSSYYITVNTLSYELNMDSTFKRFITNYKSIYQQITDIDLTNTEKCINNQGQNLFADSDAIDKQENSCITGLNHSCKENSKYSNEYTQTDYDNMFSIDNNKESWFDNDHITDYVDMYKMAVGYDIIAEQLNNTEANFWKNKYHNENQCPSYGYGKPTQEGDLYNVNPAYNYGLKWEKLPDDINTVGKIIIELYDDSVVYNVLSIDNIFLDFTSYQNDIIFKNSQDTIIDMSDIDESYYLKILYGSTFAYYKVFGSNKCSSTQICSSKSNEDYAFDFDKNVQNIYSDQEYCNNLNTKYTDRYTQPQKTSFEGSTGYNIDDIGYYQYYPTNYDNTYSSVEQTSAPQ